MEEYHCLLRTKFVVVCGVVAYQLCQQSTRAYLDGDDKGSIRLRDMATLESKRYAEAHMAKKVKRQKKPRPYQRAWVQQQEMD